MHVYGKTIPQILLVDEEILFPHVINKLEGLLHRDFHWSAPIRSPQVKHTPLTRRKSLGVFVLMENQPQHTYIIGTDTLLSLYDNAYPI